MIFGEFGNQVIKVQSNMKVSNAGYLKYVCYLSLFLPERSQRRWQPGGGWVASRCYSCWTWAISVTLLEILMPSALSFHVFIGQKTRHNWIKLDNHPKADRGNASVLCLSIEGLSWVSSFPCLCFVHPAQRLWSICPRQRSTEAWFGQRFGAITRPKLLLKLIRWHLPNHWSLGN